MGDGLTQQLIGTWVPGEGSLLTSYQPASQQIVWQGQAASQAQVTQAVQAARQAFMPWAQLTLEQRIDYLQAYAAELQIQQAILIDAICQDNGKPRWEATQEVTAMHHKINISIDAYHQRTGYQQQIRSAVQHTLRHKPHGVMAVLGPFNFPGHLPHGHMVPALLAGNTVVFKPSEHTPLVGAHLARLWVEVGLPAGVLNLVQGDATIGQALVQSEVNGVLFTGSDLAGRRIHQACAGHPEKILALEMGGHNPLIIADAASLVDTVDLVILSSFISAGQRCTCARRVIIVESQVHVTALLAALSQGTSKLAVGPHWSHPEPFMGPLIHSQAVRAWQHMIQEKIQQGAVPLVSGQRLGHGLVTPTVLDVTGLPFDDQECFGPLLQIIRVPDLEAAFTAANRTRYGLAAGILTDDPAVYQRFLRISRAGVVNWNRPLTGAASDLPFGGIGHSGNHRPSAYYAADYCAYPVASIEAPDRSAWERPPGWGTACS